MICYPIKPQPYVRMTQKTPRDGPHAKTVVKNYMAFKKKCAQYSVEVPRIRPILVFEFANKNHDLWGNEITSTPDLDNLVKGLLDSCKVVGVSGQLVDDRMVAQVHARKVYAKTSAIWVGQMPEGAFDDILLDIGYLDATLDATLG